MRNKAEKIFKALAFVTVLGLASACGSSSGSDNANNPSNLPTPTPTATPTPSCTHQLAVGDKVAYIGPRTAGSNFSNPNIAYTGTVKVIAQHILVTWDGGIGDVAVTINTITPKMTCGTDITGYNVEYIGQQTASTPNFNVVGKVYFGKVVATYGLGYIEVDWNDFGHNTIEPQANLHITK